MPGPPPVSARIALVGDPVDHSPSPQIQIAGFREVGLDWDYVLVGVPKGQLEAHWGELMEGFLGLNVTIPLKVEAARLVSERTSVAALCGSVNTVTFRASGALGDSTDGRGFMAALSRAGVDRVQRAVVLGTGGAARSVVAALAGQGTQVTVMGRNRARGDTIALELGPPLSGKVAFSPLDALSLGAALVDADLLVNATPLGGPTAPDQSPVGGAIVLPANVAVVDLVYRPRQTPLLRQAAASGCRTVEGIEMLVEQAALSFEVWTGAAAPVDVMRQAAYRANPAGAGL